MSTDTLAITGDLLEAGEAIGAVVRAEIDMQIATAKQYPRSMKVFKDGVREMSCLDEDTAISCFYVLKRGSKPIEGPSIRLAEIVAYNWTNLRFGARVIGIDEKFVTAQGMCFDLERNNAGQHETKRRITNREGVRFGDDMIQVTSNAACAIALREAIFKCVPRSMFKDIYAEIKQTAVGKAESMAQRRDKAMKWFAAAGADEKTVFTFMEVQSIEEIGLDQLLLLQALCAEIRHGDKTIEEAFQTERQTGGKAKTSDLDAKLKLPSPHAGQESPATDGGTASTPEKKTMLKAGSMSWYLGKILAAETPEECDDIVQHAVASGKFTTTSHDKLSGSSGKRKAELNSPPTQGNLL
jgi:hypothetical protein